MRLRTLRSHHRSLEGGAVSTSSFTCLPSVKGEWRDTRHCSKSICIATPLLHVTSHPLRQLQQHGITENTQDEKGAHKHTQTVSGATPESFRRVCGTLHLQVATLQRKKKRVLQGEPSQGSSRRAFTNRLGAARAKSRAAAADCDHGRAATRFTSLASLVERGRDE